MKIEYYRYKFFLLHIIVFLICINFEKEHWQNFSNYNPDSNYFYKFTEHTDDKILKYLNKTHNWDRSYDSSITQLEQREKSRWVFLTLVRETSILSSYIANNQYFVQYEKAFLQTQSFFWGIIFFLIYFFYYLTLKKILKLNSKEANNFSCAIYAAFSYLFLIFLLWFAHFRGGEDEFSLVETFLIITSIYLIFLNTKISLSLYMVICLLAPLVRESGIIISSFYFFYHFINYNKIHYNFVLLPVLSILPYIYFNFDILKFYLDDGFIYTINPINSQTDFSDLHSNFFGFLNAIFYNFIIFFIPLILFYKRDRFNYFILFYILVYFVLLGLGSVLDHISTRFMPSILILIYVFYNLYIKKMEN